MATIYDIYGNILFQDDNLSLKELVEKNKFNLKYADLSGAKLTGANLRFTDLTETQLPIYSKRFISYKLNSKNFKTSDISKIIIRIGCKEKTIQELDNWFNSDEEFDTKRGTEKFKLIQANYIAVREYLKFMVKGEN